MPDWDEAADWYLRMVRDPTRGFNQLAADTALALLGPCAGRTVLDIGCGEGWVARRLAAAGAEVCGAEPTRALLAAARDVERREPLGIRYIPDAADDLANVASDAVDAVVAVLVVHHVASLERAWSEAHRVLHPGGALVVVIPHPWTDHHGAIWTNGDAGPARRQLGNYTSEGYWRTDETDSIRGIGWHHRTVATWLTTCSAAGFSIDDLREPTGAGVDRSDGGGRWSDTPRFLAWRAHRTS